MDLRTADALSWVGRDATVDVGEPVEATDGRDPAVDGGGGQTTRFHGADVALDLGPRRAEDLDRLVGGPLEERP